MLKPNFHMYSGYCIYLVPGLGSSQIQNTEGAADKQCILPVSDTRWGKLVNCIEKISFRVLHRKKKTKKQLEGSDNHVIIV